MDEFNNRVDAQRQILRTINERTWKGEQLFALNTKAVQRWSSVNRIEASTRLVKLLSAASAQIFIMANHSDDPVAGTYIITTERVNAIENQIREELDSGQYRR